jgi:hypothetical protein
MRCRSYLMLVLAVVACSTDEHAASGTFADTARVPIATQVPSPQAPTSPFLEAGQTPPAAVWANYGTHEPSFCLVLHPEGRAQFISGFTDFNPSFWQYDSVSSRLSLNVPSLDPVSASNSGGDGKTQDPECNPAAGTLCIQVTQWTAQITLFGYILTRLDSLADWEYETIRPACPSHMPPRADSSMSNREDR